MKAWGALVLGAALIFGPTADALARPGFFVEAPRESFQFSLPSSNGYRLSVSSTDSGGQRGDLADILAQKGTLASVAYSSRDRDPRPDVIDIKLPGVGRIAVRFHPARSRTEALASNCKGPKTIVREGTFRGTIVFHGERGYSSVDAHAARGKARELSRRVCRQVKRSAPPATEEQESGDFLFAGMDTKRTSVGFTATGPIALAGTTPLVFFSASSSKRHAGFWTVATAGAAGGPSTLSVSGPKEAPTGARVAPPPPFAGSATFNLDSPTSASWLGDLSIDLPGLGRVALAGTEFWSALCTGVETCTKTLPGNVGLSAIEFRRNDQ